MDLSILIVSYNTRELTLACLESVFRETRDVHFEVILVDNASQDGSALAIQERFPGVRLIASAENLGFAGANNRAASYAIGRYLLLLNPDTLVLDGAIDKLFRFTQKLNAITGGRTLFADGSLNPGSCWGKPTPWSVFCLGSGLASLFRRSGQFHPESLGAWQRDDTRSVDIISGCLLMLERSTWNRLEGFDTTFFMYGEDFDLCLRAAAIGIPCWVCGEVEIVHHGGRSERVRADKMTKLFKARVQLYRRHWPLRWQRFGVLMHDLWAGSRYLAFSILSLIDPRHRDAQRSWREVWRMRSKWHGEL